MPGSPNTQTRVGVAEVGDVMKKWFASFPARTPAELPIAQPRERTMDALMADLEAIPSGLRHSEAAMVRKGVPDMSTFVLAQQREAANIGYAYPSQFSDHVFEGADGEQATGGEQEGRKGAAARGVEPVDQMTAGALELTALELAHQVDRAVRAGGDERQVDVGGHRR